MRLIVDRFEFISLGKQGYMALVSWYDHFVIATCKCLKFEAVHPEELTLKGRKSKSNSPNTSNTTTN
jgi:hypothetical protein